MRARLLAAALSALALAGCGADYYFQGASGQLDLIARAKPLNEVIGTTSDSRLKERLERARAIRTYASRELGFGIPVMPTGGFFVYADTSKLAADSRAFCRDVLEHAGVAITPGIDFGTHRASEHVRFAYTIARAKIEDGIARLARHLGKTLR